MNREEMLLKAKEMRDRTPFTAESEEVLNSLPAVQEEINLEVDGVNVKYYKITPKKEISNNPPLVINFHGGGFVKGRYDRDRVYCSHLADELSCIVFDVDYSLAPEAPFPAAINESVAITKYAFENAGKLGIDKDKIILIGHSAGGNLVSAAVQTLLNEKLSLPKAVIMEYFPANFSIDAVDKLTKEQKENEREMGRAEMARLYDLFYCNEVDKKNPLLSPVFANPKDLQGFPNTLILTAGADTLNEEAEDFAKLLAKSGTTVTLKRFTNSMHGFTINRMAQWEEAVGLHYEFLKNNI